jgi:hypothetical protein
MSVPPLPVLVAMSRSRHLYSMAEIYLTSLD